jgi:7-alpha-hydroxysteroid dehydrogenase
MARAQAAGERVGSRGAPTAGGEAEIFVADVSDPASAASIVRRTEDRFGRLDLLVNNAGGAAPAPYEEVSAGDLEAAFRFNVASSFELTRQATPLLLAKAALTQMTRLLAVELAPRFRVNAISPGIVATEALEEALSPEARRQIEDATPLHRLASVTDVADAAAWLASDQAGYVTGKVHELDGGAEWPVFPNDSADLEPPG